MRSILIPIFITIVFAASAQATNSNPFERKGFIIGTSFGGGYINTSVPSFKNQEQGCKSLSWKLGIMLSNRTALILYFPSTLYKYKGNITAPRQRDRGFEGIVPSVQYWVKDRWWIMGGAGLGLDNPAFYDVKDETEAKYYSGATVLIGSGYELWRKGRFALDIQSRIHYGTANVPEGIRKSTAFDILIGVNWY